MPDADNQLPDDLQHAIGQPEPELTPPEIADYLQGDEYGDESPGILSDTGAAAEDAAQVDAWINDLTRELPSITTPAAQEAMAPVIEQMLERGYRPEEIAQPDVLATIYQRAGGEQRFARIAQE